MIAQAVAKISAHEAQTAANQFLATRLPKYFRAGEPTYEQVTQTWRVPVLLDYLYAEPFGEVGQLVVNAFAGEVVSHTAMDEMEETGRELYAQFLQRTAQKFAASDRFATDLEIPPPGARVSALAAEATASHFLFDHLPDRITAGPPQFDAPADVWIVPVILAYPNIGSVGQVGEIVISAQAHKIVRHTPLDEILKNARVVYDQNRDKIEAIVL